MIINDSKILIKAILIKNKWIPIWEFTYTHSEMYGCTYHHSSDYNDFFKDHFQDVYYDINTKEIQSGIQVDIYPQNLKYKVGDKVLVETSLKKLKECEISEIVYYPEYHHIYWGQKAKEEYGRYTTEEFDFNKLYHIVIYTERYKVKGREEVIWLHQLYKLEQ